MRAAQQDLATPPVLAGIVGQPRALSVLAGSLRAPVHAYLFRGPSGSGQEEAALGFAAALICEQGGCGTCASCRAVARRDHPDVTYFERTGASISKDDAREIVARAQRTPRAAALQVLVLTEFHLVEDAAAVLLKAIEEPPTHTIFLILSEFVPPSLVTIASRCVEVPFNQLSEATIVAMLEADGVEHGLSAAVAAVCEGNIRRARLLASDPGFAQRQELWRSVPERLDGRGATIAELARELVESSSGLVEVLAAEQRGELQSALESAERAGERRIPGRAVIEERHRREQRRLRADELRSGLATLSVAYRQKMTVPGNSPRRLSSLLEAGKAIDEATKALTRNPNETLLLEHLLVQLDELN